MLQVEATWLLTPHDAALVVTGVKTKTFWLVFYGQVATCPFII
jgi:hypothetical protein